MASITSNIPGDINQAKRKTDPASPDGIQQLTRQTLQPATTSIAQVGNSRPSPMLPGDPARAARMQAQMNQPVTKVNQGPDVGGRLGQIAQDAYAIVKPIATPAATVGGILAAPVIDAGRNTLIRAAGGDPNTAEGGSTKYQDRAFNEIQPTLNAVQAAGDMARRGASSAVLSITGAQPAVAQASSQISPSGAVAQPSLPTPPKPSAPTAKGIAAPPAGGYVHSSVGGIVRRGNEFTNAPSAVAGASGQQAKAGAVNSGWDSGLELERNERANIERDRMIGVMRRGEIGSGPGGIVADSGASDRALRTASITGQLPQDAAGKVGATAQRPEGGAPGNPADEAARRNASLIDQQIAEQNLQDRKSQTRARGRLERLQEVMADLNSTPEQRSAARSAYTELTTPAKDRYVLQDVVLASDPVSGPKYGKQAIDVLTGQPVAPANTGITPPQGAIQALRSDPKKAAEFDRKYGAGASAQYL
ncbi:TPA: hypothetical protein L5X69_000662 [Pseudomonas aeruginosa]|uniref:hypothetical protein n=1 Tax=Pseudomonas aeruginosa TaxID=287 RepID=UPI000A6A9A13|nr:hypothetical protein [Pseudomonas aeruginosa]QKZ43885.1 hypothetical protein HWN45_10240 [Pseudomonas aeruginosa]HBP2507884.1 hypothetical protein [Pseudomonas aeruginosa]HBP2582158.1 hypothetical protein [Pseudomonas aeruginosa]HBP2589349.1 hypothetical protein [Pseudomonas aeruginosa]HBP2725000.1 hypothetical protein [Pseudomonas aeruginosa]